MLKSESKNDTQISGGWCGGDVIVKDINGKGGIKGFAMTLLPMTIKKLSFITIQLQLVVVHPVLD